MPTTQDDLPLSEFDQALIDIIRNEHPETLEQSIELTRSRCAETDKVIMDRVLRLESHGKILFEKPSPGVPSSLTGYLFSSWARWYWLVFGLASGATIMAFVVPEGVSPAVYARYLFGSVFVLFLPGYSLIKALFGDRELDDIERFALSIGLSLALVPMAGLFLSFTPWGLRAAPVTLCLFGLTQVFASVAVVRDYRTRRKMAEADPM